MAKGLSEGVSAKDCPSKGRLDDLCQEQANDTKNYYKACKDPGCGGFETETCYRCPKLATSSAEVSTLNGRLTCG